MGGEVVQGLNIVSECISQQVIDALVEKGEIFTCSGGVVALGLEYLVSFSSFSRIQPLS